MYWQRGNSAVRTRKTNDKLNRSDYLTEDEQIKYPPIKRLDSFDHENSDFLDQKNARRLKTKSVYQSPSVKGRNFVPSTQHTSDQKSYPKEFDQNTKPIQNGTTVPFSDIVQLKKRIISLEIQNETLEQISDLLKHKNDTMESELNHLRQTVINPDKNDDLQRELLLRESEDKRYALQQQMKQMNKQYENSIQNLIEEKSILNRENKLLRKEMSGKQGLDGEPSSKRIAELVNLVDDLKVILNKKNEEQEKLQYKIEMMEQERGVRLQLDENDDYKRPSAVLNSYRDQQALKDGKVSNNEAEFNQKIRDYEETILRKNRDLERQEDKNKKISQAITDAYNVIRQYYKEVIIDSEAHKSIDNRVTKAQSLQENDNKQLNEILKELLLRREGLEVTMKQEIQNTNQKMKILEEEISKQDEMTKHDFIKVKNEFRNAKDKSKELSVFNAQLEQQLAHEKQERTKLLKEYELQKNEFMRKIKDLNTEINQIVNSTENEINKMKIENYQNQEQNKQLLQLISNKEREIAQLRYKLVQSEEEIQRARKKTLEGGSSQFNMPAIRQQGRSSSGFDKTIGAISTPSSALKAKLSPNNMSGNLNQSTLSNFKNGNGSAVMGQTPNSRGMASSIAQPTNDANNPFMKIKYIRSLKEWAVYWKYYQDNISYRIQLLEKTDSLRENFTQSEELKPKVFREALEVDNVQMYELTTLLMADTIDLDRLTKEEIRMIQNGHIIVKNLRPPRMEEDIQDYHNLHMSALKVLSYMDNSNMDWTEAMSDEIMNVNGLKALVQYIKQDAKEWPKLLSLNVLHMMARKKALINFMVSYDIAQPLLDNLDNINGEIQRATLALLVPLLPEEQFINSIKDIKQLLKLSQLIMSDNNSILSNSLQCMSLIIPTFSYQKMLYKTDVIERIASVGGTSPYPTTRIHALNLFKKLIEHANEKECEMLNVQGSGLILRNLEMAEGETLKEMTPLRDVLYRSLKIIRSLIEDFPCPDEHLLCQRIMRLFCDIRLKNDNKIEQLVLEIIHILWDKMESVMINHLHDRDVLKAIVEGYLRSANLTDGINYGLMLVGICEKETMNGYIIDLKGRELLMKVIQNCHHMDYKTAITSAKILVFLVQEQRTYEHIDAGDLNGIAKLLKKEETQEEFISHSLDIVFYTMKHPKGIRSLIDFEIVESLFQLMDESLYSVNIMVKCFQCLELVHTLYTERELLKEMCIDDENTGSDILNGLANMCLVKVQKDLGMSSLFFWRFLAKQSAANDMITVVYQRADEFIQTLVKLKKSYLNLVPELSSQISTILQNLSYKSAEIRDIVILNTLFIQSFVSFIFYFNIKASQI